MKKKDLKDHIFFHRDIMSIAWLAILVAHIIMIGSNSVRPLDFWLLVIFLSQDIYELIKTKLSRGRFVITIEEKR